MPFSNYGMYYNPMTIVNDDSRVITKLETSLTDNVRFIIYDHHKFIVQANSLTFANGTGPYLYERGLRKTL
jgi:hypothetical protein